MAQLIDGTLGMGYGVFSATLVIAAGIYPAIASASVHTAEIFITPVSGGPHLWFGNVKKHRLLPLVIPGLLALLPEPISWHTNRLAPSWT